MKIHLNIDSKNLKADWNYLHLFVAGYKFCFYNSNSYDAEDFVKHNIRIFKRLKYSEERMLKEGCWMKNEAELIKELF